MKKYFTLLLLLCCVLASGQEKIFNTALKNGRQYGKFYVAENPREQQISKEDCDAYAKAHDYYIGSSQVKRISRFGSVTGIVVNYHFLPKSEYDTFLYECFGYRNVPFSSLNKKGSGILYSNAMAEPVFQEINDIYWNGALDNGRLHGKGVGFAHFGNACIVFDANFDKGFPVGDNTFMWFSTDDSSGNRHDWTILTGQLKNGIAYYKYGSKYGFVKSNGHKLTPMYKKMVSDFKGNVSPESDYAVVVTDDDIEWKLNIKGNRFAYSDKQQKIFDDQKAAEEAAARKAAEEKRLAAEKAARERKEAELKAAEDRRIAMEKQRIYNQKVKENSDPKKWDVGDRLCLVMDANNKLYVTGTIEEWNSTKTKVKIKIVTSPGSRMTYNGENLEKNTTMWVATTGEGWHLALPEELEAANQNDHSTHVRSSTIKTAVKCSRCDGKGHLGSYYDYKKCPDCDGTGFINDYQTITL